MAYETAEQLPNEVKESLPKGGQNIFMAAFNSASSDGLSEEQATQVAWNSVKNIYRQTPEGKWEQKPEPATGNPSGTMAGG
ncbi:MAG: putative cation transport regulator ChaB [Chroococcopsis gigantea SAG 12.99]|jgi:cation transport regulator|nr:putative cation transport regulator ChaB [Chroococcopsis gigantea SAG 12.99]